jgi:hypothetical protein
MDKNQNNKEVGKNPVFSKAMDASGKMHAQHRIASTGARHQRGMGATIVLFTIALIVLVGAALAYASRDNPTSISTQSARIYAAVLLKQSADYRDAYSRFIFDGGDASTMTFDQTASVGLFNPTTQYGTYQLPPAQAVASGTTPAWSYNGSVLVNGVGTPTGAESITYVMGLSATVCGEVNNQLYGSATIPDVTPTSVQVAASGTTIDVTPAGRSIGCFKTAAPSKYVFYSTLGES